MSYADDIEPAAADRPPGAAWERPRWRGAFGLVTALSVSATIYLTNQAERIEEQVKWRSCKVWIPPPPTLFALDWWALATNLTVIALTMWSWFATRSIATARGPRWWRRAAMTGLVVMTLMMLLQILFLYDDYNDHWIPRMCG